MSKIITIAGTTIERGTNVKLKLEVAKLPSNTTISIPVNVYRSKKDGPTLLLLAGMHGDEINGTEIIRRMIVEKSIFPQKGSVIAIPILNIYGFLNYSREVPDGKDVNRSFPGNTRGSLASRMAYLFMKEIFPHVDFGLDFHTGGGNRSNYPQIRCMIDKPDQYEMAKHFGAPFLLNAKLRDKSLRKESTLKGKPIVVYEAGESLRLDEFAIAEGIAGAKRVMNYLGMSNHVVEEAKESVLFSTSTWIRANRSGIFNSYIKPGDKVSKSEILGIITDPFGEFLVRVKAPKDGYIVGLSYSPVVSQGDALIHIGVV